MKIIDAIMRVLSESSYPMTVDEIRDELEKINVRKTRDLVAAHMSSLKSAGRVINGESDYSQGRARLTWLPSEPKPKPVPFSHTINEPVIEMKETIKPEINMDPVIETMAVVAPDDDQELREHPLYAIFMGAIRQAMYGKGERHGGAKTPFLKQPWVHYAELHGRGFLTGQAAKKMEEAASTRSGESYETEAFGAMVYIGMSILHDQKQKD